MFQKYDKLFAGGFLLLLSVVILSQISNIRYVDIALGPRFFPRIVGIAMLIIAVLLILFGLPGLKKARETPTPRLNKQAALQIILSLLMLVVFGVLLPLMGIIVAGIVYIAGSFLILAPREKWNIPVFLILSVSVPIMVYFLFSYGFKVLLPSGILWR